MVINIYYNLLRVGILHISTFFIIFAITKNQTNKHIGEQKMKRIGEKMLSNFLSQKDNKPYDYIKLLSRFSLSNEQMDMLLSFIENNNIFESNPTYFNGFVELLLVDQKETTSETIKNHLSFFEKYDNFFFILSYSNIKLSESFMLEFSDKLNWNYLSFYQNLSESFVEKHIDKVNFENYIIKHIVSENFIEKHINMLTDACWNIISKFYPLSQSFKEKYADKLNR